MPAATKQKRKGYELTAEDLDQAQAELKSPKRKSPFNRQVDKLRLEETNGHVPLPGQKKLFEDLKRKGKSRPKSDAQSDTNKSLMADIEVLREQDIPFDLICKSRENWRKDFDEELIKKMAPDIVKICELNPITVREQRGDKGYELIDGETRFRAGMISKPKALKGKIIRCTDAQAAMLRLLSAVQRRDLNPIERARGILALQEQYGLSQRQLETEVGLSQSAQSNYTRLLSLPKPWLDRVISGEISGTAARDLVPWCNEPAVLEEAAKELKRLPAEERSGSIERVIQHAVSRTSCPIHGYCWDGKRNWDVKLQPDAEQITLLRIRQVKTYRGVERRAFNLELWTTLAKAYEAEQRRKEDAKTQQPKSKGLDVKESAAEERERKKKQAEVVNKRMYRFKIAWYQRRLIEAVPFFGIERKMLFVMYLAKRKWISSDLELKELLKDERNSFDNAKALIIELLQESFEGWNPRITPEEIEMLAQHCGIDIEKKWPKIDDWKGETCDFLELLSTAEVRDFAHANGCTPVSTKKMEMIDEFLKDVKPIKCPEQLANAKAVPLR